MVMGKLVNIAGGAISLFLGLILWITFSVIGGIAAGLGHFDPGLYNAMVAGFFLMIVGPAIFWIVLPLVERYRRRRKAVEPVTPLPVHFCPGCGAEVSAATERFCWRCGRRL
jgi:hypothetical protein